MDFLDSGWRIVNWPDKGGDGFPHANLPKEEGRSVFEQLEQSELPEDETYIVWRGERVFAILNVYPYTHGHIMVLPKVAAPSLLDLDGETHHELWEGVRLSMRAVKAAFGPDGLNVGINEGEAGGGSVPSHLHVHVVPRRRADTNFMTTTAGARVLPMSLHETWRRLKAAWPAD